MPNIKGAIMLSETAWKSSTVYASSGSTSTISLLAATRKAFRSTTKNPVFN